jgi:uncharacterized protein (DUF305 family)
MATCRIGFPVGLLSAACVGALVACASSGSPSPEQLETLYRARTDSMRMRFDEADVAFVTGMLAHHAQAIEMAELAPQRTESSSVRTLAARIINAQRDEIALMERWLRDRDQAVPESGAEAHAAHLAGMLTAAELEELRRSTAGAFDRLFLTYMIRHHEGAIAMVEALLAAERSVQDPATFELASDIHVDQSTEIARMQQLLTMLPTGGAG